MPKIVISEFIDGDALATLQDRADVIFDAGLVDRPADLMDQLANADALIVRNRTQVRGDLLEAGGKLRVVGRLGVGLDNIDMDACKVREIEVIPAIGANADSVAEYVITTALLLYRPAYSATAQVTAGAWPRQALIGREIGGRTLGLLGFGSIARRVAIKAKAMNMAILAYDPFVEDSDPVWAELGAAPGSFDDVIERADVVSLHLPLTPQTANLMDRSVLARMKQGTMVINTARGGIIDEAALADLLADGHLGGAAIDVFAEEPLKAGSALNDCPNLIATPHIAGVTDESNARVGAMIADRVLAALGS